MYLKKKLIFFTTFISLFIFIGCETQTNYQTNTNSYNKPLISDSKKKINNLEKTKTVIKNNYTGQDEILNVGLMLPLSGEYYLIGRSLLNSAQLAIDKTRNKKIIFRIIDTGNEEKIISELYNLLERDIDIFIGPIFSDKVEQVREIINEKNIPIISLSNNSKLQDKGLYIFGLTLEDEIRKLLNYSIENNLTKYAVILPKNEFGFRIEKEINNFKTESNITSFKYTFYEPSNPDFYEVSKVVSNYHERKLNLENRIKILNNKKSEEAQKELKQLKKMDTLGELNFQAVIIFAQNFQEVSNFSSILPYYDVDPKKIQYMGNSMWGKNLALKEPGLESAYFTSLNLDNRKKFDADYVDFFKSRPHSLATLTYDLVGLIGKLHLENNKFNIGMLHTQSGFVGINGWFRILPDGKVLRKPKIYGIKNQNFILLN